jgi:hypothetical protein
VPRVQDFPKHAVDFSTTTFNALLLLKLVLENDVLLRNGY